MLNHSQNLQLPLSNIMSTQIQLEPLPFNIHKKGIDSPFHKYVKYLQVFLGQILGLSEIQVKPPADQRKAKQKLDCEFYDPHSSNPEDEIRFRNNTVLWYNKGLFLIEIVFNLCSDGHSSYQGQFFEVNIYKDCQFLIRFRVVNFEETGLDFEVFDLNPGSTDPVFLEYSTRINTAIEDLLGSSN